MNTDIFQFWSQLLPTFLAVKYQILSIIAPQTQTAQQSVYKVPAVFLCVLCVCICALIEVDVVYFKVKR